MWVAAILEVRRKEEGGGGENCLYKYDYNMFDSPLLKFSEFITLQEIFHGAQKMLRKIQGGKQMQDVLHASKSLFQFFTSLAQ